MVNESFNYNLLNTNPRIQAILWSILDHTITELDYEDCVIYLLDHQRRSLYQCAAHGPKKAVSNRILNPISIPLGRGVVGTAAKFKRTMLISDTRNWSDYILDLKPGLSEIAAPIVYNGQLLGVIDTESPQLNYYTKNDLIIINELALFIANTIAAEIHRHNLQVYLNTDTTKLTKSHFNIDEAPEYSTQYQTEKLGLTKLTQTEKLILAEIAKSKTSKEIARSLHKSHRTIEVHRQNICKKLGLKGPNALIHYVGELYRRH